MKMEDWMAVILVFILGGVAYLIWWMGKMDGFRTSVESNIDTIQTDIKRILGLLTKTPYSPGSPIRLNDLGKEISQELGAAEWAKNEADNLIPRVRGKEPYEIQEYCFEYVTMKGFAASEEGMKQVQNSAYNHGLDVGQVLRVIGIELRDVLLERVGLQAP